MNHLPSSLYAVAIASCLLCAAVVDGRRAARRFNFLTAYLLLEALRYLFLWLMAQPAAPAKALWLGLLMVSSLLVAPVLWLFAREVAERQPLSWRALRGPHLAPLAASALLTLPLLLTTHGGTGYAEPGHVASPGHSLFIHTTMMAAIVLFLAQVPVYLRDCIRRLGLRGSLFARCEPNATGTLRLLIVIASANWAVGLLRTLHCLVLGADTGLGLVFCGLEVGTTAAVLFVLMRRAAVFSLEGSEPEATKYARSSLDNTTRARIHQKLAGDMAARRLHRDAQLTLRGLCDALNENPHYVSQVINQDLGTSFHDLMKQARIADAQATLLAEPASAVLDIALAVGFNSKSSFNAAFRQLAGMTPREYRALHSGTC